MTVAARDLPLSTQQVAERLGISSGSWRARVHREQAPAPDGRFDERTPYWWTTTIDAYAARTNGQLATAEQPIDGRR